MTERLTIIDFVEKYVSKFSKNPFLWEKNLDTNEWESTTYEETLKKAKRIAAGLMALGVQMGEKVSYLSEGRDMWVIGELADRVCLLPLLLTQLAVAIPDRWSIKVLT